MEFKYQYKVRVSDLWQVYMYYTYSSYLKIISPVCTAVMLILLAVFWGKLGMVLRGVLILLAAFFLVIHPLLVWLNCIKQLRKRAPQLEIIFREGGLYITSGAARERKKWSQIRQVAVKPTLVAIYVDNNVGYILNNRVLGKTREKFLEFVRAHTDKVV